MEQNLSEKERKIRLFLGLIGIATAMTLYRYNFRIEITVGTILISLGLLLNYFTCFCGLKKLLSSFKT